MSFDSPSDFIHHLKSKIQPEHRRVGEMSDYNADFEELLKKDANFLEAVLSNQYAGEKFLEWAAANNDVKAIETASAYYKPDHNISHVMRHAIEAGNRAAEGNPSLDEHTAYAAAHLLLKTYGKAVAFDPGSFGMSPLPADAGRILHQAPELAIGILRHGITNESGQELYSFLLDAVRKNESGKPERLELVIPNNAEKDTFIECLEGMVARRIYGNSPDPSHPNPNEITGAEMTQGALNIMDAFIQKGHGIDSILEKISLLDGERRKASLASVVTNIQQCVAGYGTKVTIPERVQQAFSEIASRAADVAPIRTNAINPSKLKNTGRRPDV